MSMINPECKSILLLDVKYVSTISVTFREFVKDFSCANNTSSAVLESLSLLLYGVFTRFIEENTLSGVQELAASVFLTPISLAMLGVTALLNCSGLFLRQINSICRLVLLLPVLHMCQGRSLK